MKCMLFILKGGTLAYSRVNDGAQGSQQSVLRVFLYFFKSLMAMIFIALLQVSSADLPATTASLIDFQEMQRKCLDELIAPADYPETEGKFPIMRNYFAYQMPRDNVCLWRGIICEGPLVRAIVININTLAYPADVEGLLQINWLPPSLRIAVFKGIYALSDWGIEKLPRETRLFAMNFCASYNRVNPTQKELNFSKLPDQIEEFYIVDHDSLWIRNVLLSDLPKSLRKLHITNYYTKVVRIAFENLPEGLVTLSIGNGTVNKSNQVKIRATGRIKSDPRVKNIVMWELMLKDTHYRPELTS